MTQQEIVQTIELEQADGNLHKYLADLVNTGLQFGGEKVEQQQYLDRLGICSGCEKAGTVKVGGFEFIGCQVCGCPFATKPYWKKYFSFIKLRIVKSRCPHEIGNKWEQVDKKYNFNN